MIFMFVSSFLINVKKEWYKKLFNASKNGIAIFTASFIFHYFFPSITLYDLYNPFLLIILMISTLLYEILTMLFVFIVVTIEKRKFDVNSFISAVTSTKSAYLTVFLGIINVVLFYYTNLIGVALFTFLIYFIRPALQYRYIFDNELSTYTTFILHILKQMDPITYGHSERVKYWTILMAKKMKLPQSEIRQLSQAASWHDVGKIEIPLNIIDKPSKLTDEEYALMKSHPEVGYQLVKEMHFFKKFLPVIRCHHEKIDGTGYPMGLKGEEIPMHARIMAITDAFDAMTYDRSYRQGMPLKDAVEELLRYSGTQFDENLVKVFIEALKDKFGDNYEKYTKELLSEVS